MVKFDSFDGDHPKFESYPFRQRTRLIYDHEGHFGKHFPEVAKKDPARRVPETCATCHNSGKDRRVMAVAPFEQTCTSCHLDQITGKERVSGPKGVAFLALPGLDLATLKKKKAAIGEWPEASEAELTPFMKVMIGRSARGRALIKTVDRLNLQDLSRANDAQIKAVAALVWEIKGLFYALIKGKASDVLADLTIDGMGKLSAALIADLTASMPSDVVISAHQHWLPNLGAEMAGRMEARAPEQGGWTTTIKESRVAVDSGTASIARSGRRRSSRAANRGGEFRYGCHRSAGQRGSKGRTRERQAVKETVAADAPPRAKAADQTDDLLFPTPEELRATKSGAKDTAKAGRSQIRGCGTEADARSANRRSSSGTRQAPIPRPGRRRLLLRSSASKATSIRRTGPSMAAGIGRTTRSSTGPPATRTNSSTPGSHLTGPKAPKGTKSPAAAVFDALASKDAQGSCTKCHSVDDLGGQGACRQFHSGVGREQAGTLHAIRP